MRLLMNWKEFLIQPFTCGFIDNSEKRLFSDIILSNIYSDVWHLFRNIILVTLVLPQTGSVRFRLCCTFREFSLLNRFGHRGPLCCCLQSRHCLIGGTSSPPYIQYNPPIWSLAPFFRLRGLVTRRTVVRQKAFGAALRTPSIKTEPSLFHTNELSNSISSPSDIRRYQCRIKT